MSLHKTGKHLYSRDINLHELSSLLDAVENEQNEPILDAPCQPYSSSDRGKEPRTPSSESRKDIAKSSDQDCSKLDTKMNESAIFPPSQKNDTTGQYNHIISQFFITANHFSIEVSLNSYIFEPIIPVPKFIVMPLPYNRKVQTKVSPISKEKYFALKKDPVGSRVRVRVTKKGRVVSDIERICCDKILNKKSKYMDAIESFIHKEEEGTQGIILSKMPGLVTSRDDSRSNRRSRFNDLYRNDEFDRRRQLKSMELKVRRLPKQVEASVVSPNKTDRHQIDGRRLGKERRRANASRTRCVSSQRKRLKLESTKRRPQSAQREISNSIDKPTARRRVCESSKRRSQSRRMSRTTTFNKQTEVNPSPHPLFTNQTYNYTNAQRVNLAVPIGD